MRRILLVFFLSMLAFYAAAQERPISGRVTSSEDGEGLPGVNVTVKNSGIGAITDTDGRYTLAVTGNNAVLVFSFISYVTQEVATEGRSVVDVVLSPDLKQLSEVVVTGQGAGIEKRRLSTTVDVVTSDKFRFAPVTRLDQLLQSQLPNTQINMSSGAPGSGSIIRSRGVSSALKSTTPVIYIDGVRVDNLNTASALSIGSGGAQSSALADIPVEDIDRVEFVKGGAATTLYGADAANGVIQIFTKRGKAGQNIFSFETQLGSIHGTSDFMKYKETSELGFRDGFLQSYRLGASGGNDGLTYSVSGNIYDDNSFTRGLEQRRYNLRGSLNAKISDKANYSLSTAYTSSAFTRLNNANSSFDIIGGIDQAGFGNPEEWDEATRNEMQTLVDDIARLSNLRETVSRFQTSHGFIYNPIEKVTVSLNIGLDYRYSRQKQIQTNEYLIALGVVAPGTNNQGTITIADRNFLSTTGSLNVQWTEEPGDFSFITTGGGQFFRDIDKQLFIQALNVTEGSESINNAASRTSNDFLSTVTNYGFFVAENVGLKDKYFLDLGVRVDYNTAFGQDVGGQVFPKAGVSYMLSEEGFMSNIENVLSSVKLRASYGLAGNFPPPFTRDRLVLVNAYNGSPAFQPGQRGDRNLKPERTATFEVGTDIALFNDRITLGVTYFDALTEDALFTAPFAPSQGDENQTRNLGEISNKGLELSLQTQIIKTENWNLSFNASANTVKNEVVSSGGAPEFTIGGFTFLGSFVKEGFPVGYFRGSQPTFAEDGTIASVEQNVNLGSPIPDAFGSFGVNLSYQNIQLYVGGDYQVGAEVVNTNEVLRFANGFSDDRVPEASQGESFFDLAGVWVEEADYLKIRNIGLSYNLPSSWFGNRIRNASIGFSAINPFNFVSGTTIDPELTGSGAPGNLPGTNTPAQQIVTVGGFNFGTFSAPRQFIGTLRFNF